MVKKLLIGLIPVIAIFAVSACMEEKMIPGEGELVPTDKYSVRLLVGSNSTTTKGGKATTTPYILEDIPVDEINGQEYFLQESVVDMDASFPSGTSTKGVPTYTENFASLHDTFGAKVFEAGTTTEFTDGGNQFYISDESTSARVEYKYDFYSGFWPKDAADNLMFFMSAPDQVASYQAGVTGVTYNTDGSIKIAYTSPTAAADQTDILFTSKNLSREAYNKQDEKLASVLFYHTLAGVKFKAGNVGDLVTTITSIKITGIYSSGECTITPNFDEWGYGESDNVSNEKATTDYTKSRAVSVWDAGKYSGNASSSFERTELTASSVINADKSLFPESFYGGASGTLGDNNIMDSAFKNTFFFIPQTTPAGAEIEIKYKITDDKGNSQNYKKSLSFAGRKWYAGELYTYTLTGKDLDVHITDSMGNTASGHSTKSDVTITNTGNMDAYMRVAIVGNWFDSHEYSETNLIPGHIITNNCWDIESEMVTGEGTGTGAGASTTARLVINENWTYSANDGFFYYKHPVKGGATISNPIFDEYTHHDIPEAAHLEMDLAVQSVDAATYHTAAWPWENAVGLDTTIDNGGLTTSK